MGFKLLQLHTVGPGPASGGGDLGRADGASDDGASGQDGRDADPPESAGLLAFESIYEEHFTFAWRSLRLLGVAEDVLEDAAQDVFAIVSHKLPQFAGRSSLRTWIFGIVQHTAANYRRRHRRKIKPLVPLRDQVLGDEPTPHAHAEAVDAAHRIDAYCESLDPERRALFVLVLIEDVPVPDAARAFGLPLNTVYSRIRALRTGLERALAGREEGHD